MLINGNDICMPTGGRLRHAFIGIGFRERPEAYDFQAALHDHMKYSFVVIVYRFNFSFIIKYIYSA